MNIPITPLEHLTAENCRNAIKEFDGLPYSLEEAETAECISKAITKHARLGFSEVRLFIEISDKMQKCLEGRGFNVTPFFLTKKIVMTYSAFAVVESGVAISWGESMPQLPDGYHATYDEADKERVEWQKERNELLDKCRNEIHQTRLQKEAAADRVPLEPSSVGGGYLVIAVGILISLIAAAIHLLSD